jgi:hypothetical protein
MAGPSKKMHMCDEVVLYELLQENAYSDISESEYSSDSEINVKISSCGEERVSALVKNQMSVKTVACSMAYGQSEALSYHVCHLLASLA